METKNVFSEEQIIEFKNSNKDRTSQTNNELYLKGMLISCFAYGELDKKSHSYKQYVEKYESILGKKLFNEIYDSMVKYFENFKVETNIYTDEEGCTYNSIVPK